MASAQVAGSKTTIEFDDHYPRLFLIATVVWGIVALLVGVIIASQLNTWKMNFGLEWLTFGRLRPLHTNAAIFAFVGNMMFAGIYYSTQRLCKCRTASDKLTKIHFWGWQSVIVLAAVTLPLGLTRGKEYAELIWPINLLVAVIWLAFGWNFFWTLAKRNERSLYVALWFYIATIMTVTLLYVVNHLQIPTSLTHAYPIFGGVQDALVQWWYGHNAVAFFLTTPILGIMYYFLPKAAGRPVYSYRLSIVHFWSLVFLYIWAGPHHLLNTDLPQWLQTIGVFFSLMLWAPSWGGMLNGLLTLRGGWARLRTDPVIKFFAVAVTFYGMATFEGPLLAIRSVNALSHYTDWTIGHVHSGTLGWNGFMAAGLVYWMAPRLWGTRLYSTNLANMHFWLGLVGILLYVSSMWVSGIMQGLLLNATKADGTLLVYAEFVETIQKIQLPMFARLCGGTLYLAGFIILAYNFYRTIKAGKPVNETREVILLERAKDKRKHDRMTIWQTFTSDPVLIVILAVLFMCLWFFAPRGADLGALIAAILLICVAVLRFRQQPKLWEAFHDRLLENWLPFSALGLVSVAIGGAIQIIPVVTVNTARSMEDRLQVPYTPLELAGRDIYISEGCYNCHSQMIRTLVKEVMRYGDYSRIGESIYDHPFQWGSKRNGPDLAREGGRRSNGWHFQHMMNPRMVEGSTMPIYPWLYEKKTDFKSLPKKIGVQRTLGVPYPPMTSDVIRDKAEKQALEIAKDLKDTDKVFIEHDREIVALIAYLQKLGTWEKPDWTPPPVLPGPSIPDNTRKTSFSPKEETTEGAE